MKWKYSLIILLTLLGFSTTQAQKKATLYRAGVVVGEYSTIQEAINNVTISYTAPFDSIVLSPHTFYEHDIIIWGRKVIIKGSSKNGSRIDAEGKGRVFFIAGFAILDDVIMENGFSTSDGGGIFADLYTGGAVDNYIKLRGNSILRNCYSKRHGGGVFLSDKTLYLEDNAQIINNRADSIGGGFWTMRLSASGNPLVADNKARDGGGGAIFASKYPTSASLSFADAYGLRVINNYASRYCGALAGDFRLGDNCQLLYNKAGKAFNAFGVSLNNLEDEKIGVFGTGNFVVNSYIYNPDSSGRRNFETYIHGSSGNWYGNTDTSNIIKASPIYKIVLYSYVVCDWSVNRGKVLGAADTVFPISAHFRLNNGKPLPKTGYTWLKGTFRASGGGSFLDSIVQKSSFSDTLMGWYKSFSSPTPSTRNIIFMAWVDADTFRTTQLVWSKVAPADTTGTSISSTTQLNALKVQVYPMPAKVYLHISGAPVGTMARLYDMSGRMVQQELLLQSESQLHIAKLPVGHYILQLRTYDGAEANAKVLKE